MSDNAGVSKSLISELFSNMNRQLKFNLSRVPHSGQPGAPGLLQCEQKKSSVTHM